MSGALCSVITMGMTLAACGGGSTRATQDATARIDAAPPPVRTVTPIHIAPTGVTSSAVHDIAVDAAGGVWATTDHFVMYQPKGGAMRRFSASDGLALRDGGAVFAGVGAGRGGQAVIGTRGHYVDVVDVQGDGSLAVHHVAITDPRHVEKVTMGISIVLDPGSAYGGTAWVGAEHGTAAIHGISDPAGYCWGNEGCFEEHRHPGPDGNPSGTVGGLAVCANHDLWTGDEHWLARMPWGGNGSMPDFWAVGAPNGYPDPLIDAFPGAADEIDALVCDRNAVLWVGSFGQGLLEYDTNTGAMRYFDTANALPEMIVTSIAEDVDGSIWVATQDRGIARYWPGEDRWTYYTADSGLKSDYVQSIAVDATSTPRRVLIGDDMGLSEYTGD
jgi:hypothetical protein